MRSQQDFAHFREAEQSVSLGDTIADVICGIVMMLAIIAFGFDLIGFLS